MSWSLIEQNLISPPILFFGLGLFAAWVKSDLEIPQPIAKFLSLYLLLAIGLKGGYKMSISAMDAQVIGTLGVAVLAAFITPVICFLVLRLRMTTANSAAIAATYGSISAVTFITAMNFLDGMDVSYGGHMVAAMALMESPAVVVGILLMAVFGGRKGNGGTGSHTGSSGLVPEPSSRGDSDSALDSPEVTRTYGGTSRGDAVRWGGFNLVKRKFQEVEWKVVVREALFSGAVLLLMGAMGVGYITGKEGWESVAPFADAPFYGVLCLFLLDMGIVAARRLRQLKGDVMFLLAFGLVAPPVLAGIGIGLAYLMNLPTGDALLLAVLVGSASYIAVPAAMRMSIPEANPSYYVTLALGITFPFNIVFGIPLYMAVIQSIW